MKPAIASRVALPWCGCTPAQPGRQFGQRALEQERHLHCPGAARAQLAADLRAEARKDHPRSLARRSARGTRSITPCSSHSGWGTSGLHSTFSSLPAPSTRSIACVERRHALAVDRGRARAARAALPAPQTTAHPATRIRSGSCITTTSPLPHSAHIELDAVGALLEREPHRAQRVLRRAVARAAVAIHERQRAARRARTLPLLGDFEPMRLERRAQRRFGIGQPPHRLRCSPLAGSRGAPRSSSAST